MYSEYRINPLLYKLMDQNNGPIQLHTYITQMVSNPDNACRAQAEANLSVFLMDKLLALEALMQLSLQPDIPKREREIVFILIGKVVKADNQDDYAILSKIFDVIMVQLLSNRNMDEVTRARFGEITVSLVSSLLKQRKNSVNVHDKIAQIINQTVNQLQLSSSIDYSLCHGLILVLYVCFKTITVDAALSKIFHRYSGTLSLIAEGPLSLILAELPGPLYSQNHLSNPDRLKDLEIRFTIIKSFTELIKAIVKASLISRNSKIGGLVFNAPFLQQMLCIVLLKIGDLNIDENNVIINSTKVQLINNELNVIKRETIIIFSHLFRGYLKEKSSSKETVQAIYKSVTKTILSSIYTYSIANDLHLESQKPNSVVPDLLRACVKYLLSSAAYSEYYDIYSTSYSLLIKHVILPSLVADQTEIDSLDDNPSEFVNYNDQLIRYPNNSNIKSMMVSLLSNICTHIDGAMRFTFFCVIDLISCIIKRTLNDESVCTSYSTQLNDSKYNSIKETSKLESGLLVLSVLNKVAENQRHILDAVENFINEFSSYLSINNELIKVRFIFFMTSYIDKIFIRKDQINKRKEMFEWLLSQIQSLESVSMAAVLNLERLLKSSIKGTRKILYEDLADKFIVAIRGQLIDTEKAGPLELFRHFLKNNSNYFNDHVQLFKQLIQQLKFIILSNQNINDPVKRNIREAAWACYQIVCQQKSLAISYFDLLTDHFQQITNIFKGTTSLNDWENLTQCYASIIKLTKKTPKNINDILLCVVKLQHNNNNLIFEFTPLIWSVMYNLDKQLQLDTIEILFQIIITSFDSILASANIPAQQTNEACILISLLVQHIYLKLNPSQLLVINRIHSRILSKAQNQDTDIRTSVIEKIYEINLSLYYRHGLGPFIPEDNVYLISLSNWINDLKHFESIYDIKLLCCGLIKLLESLPISSYGLYKSEIVQLFNFLTLYMRFIQNLQLLKIHVKLKPDRKIESAEEKCKSIHTELATTLNFDLNNKSIWFNNYIEEFTNKGTILYKDKKGKNADDLRTYKQKSLNNFNSCVLREDEYIMFRTLYHKFKTCSSGIWNAIQSESYPVTLKYLPDVVKRISYVEVNEETELKKLRLVVKLSKKYN